MQQNKVFSLFFVDKGISPSSKDPTWTLRTGPHPPSPLHSWVQTHFSYENSLRNTNGLWNQARRFSTPTIPPCSIDLPQGPLRVIYMFLISSPHLDPSFALRSCSANVCWRSLSIGQSGATQATLLSVSMNIICTIKNLLFTLAKYYDDQHYTKLNLIPPVIQQHSLGVKVGQPSVTQWILWIIVWFAASVFHILFP